MILQMKFCCVMDDGVTVICLMEKVPILNSKGTVSNGTAITLLVEEIQVSRFMLHYFYGF